ncbi:hypothetical protein M413DRAFT_442059 [Hebeloma cylindrosporum]|uniref:SWIM-type domain-containing protein n=1 Tax=Hebeloma cylindrosporum TaxID=76867 RepID=A0A0C2Y6A0_HEBCY|nr:hypothetical protein M413DRAFT_442059 [Hebeloma cylindrosporum h7]
MGFEDLLLFTNAIINSIKPDNLTDDILTTLRAILPEKTLIAALDVIDRGNVIHYVTAWGHSEYEVLGSTATYAVLLDVPLSPIPYSCACPAFIHLVVMSRTHIMCKHVLAALIARKMNLCIEQPTSADDLAALYLRQFPSPEKEFTKITATTT